MTKKARYVTFDDLCTADIVRFVNKIQFKNTNECWEWSCGITDTGYGFLGIYKNNYRFRAHRLAYMIFNGPLDPDLTIDHICMNRLCVNPKHLRQVDRVTNTLENSLSASVLNLRKTHCKNGHEFNKENTDWVLRANGRYNRRCKICHGINNRRRNAKYRTNKKTKKMAIKSNSASGS